MMTDSARTNNIPADDILTQYIAEATLTPLLTAAEEKTLAKQIEQGLEAEQILMQSIPITFNINLLHRQVELGQAARARMIVANTRLVINLAKRFSQQSNVAIDDLIQEGNIGLIRAVDLFDYRRGTRFSTYATWWIRQHIIRAVNQYSRMIRVPTHVIDKYTKLKKLSAIFEKEHSRAVTVEELAIISKFSVSEVTYLLALFRPVASLEEPYGANDDYSRQQQLADDSKHDPQNRLTELALERALQKALSTLPAREERIIALRFGLFGEIPLSRQEVSQRFGLNRERIRQLEKQAINRLRHLSVADELAEFYGEVIN